MKQSERGGWDAVIWPQRYGEMGDNVRMGNGRGWKNTGAEKEGAQGRKKDGEGRGSETGAMAESGSGVGEGGR